MSKGLQLLVWWPSRLQTEKDQAAGVLTRLHCEVINAQGRVVSQQDSLPQELPRNLPATLLLHPDDISLLPVNVPEIKGKQAASALAFATEPLVLADIDDLFISAHGKLQKQDANDRGSDGNWRTVACVEKLRARSILVAVAGMGLNVQRISCEPLMFDVRGRDVWLIETPTGAWVCSHASPPWMLMADEIRTGAQRLKSWRADHIPTATGPLLLVSRTPSVRTQWEAATGLTYEVLGRDALSIGSDTVQLLPERDMRQANRGRGATASAWRLPLQLAAACVALAVILLNVAAQRVRNADRAIDAAVEAAFARAMPNTPMVADPILMLERARQQLAQSSQGGSSAFTRLLHAGASQMQSVPFNAVSVIQYDGTTLNMSFAGDVPEAQRKEIDGALRGQQMRSTWQTDEKKRNRVSLTWNRN